MSGLQICTIPGGNTYLHHNPASAPIIPSDAVYGLVQQIVMVHIELGLWTA